MVVSGILMTAFPASLPVGDSVSPAVDDAESPEILSPVSAAFGGSDDAEAVKVEVQHRPCYIFRRLRDGKRSDFFFVKGRLQNGKQFLRSTGCARKADAVKAGKALFAAALAERLDVLASWSNVAPARVVTLGEILEAWGRSWERYNVKLNANVADGYAQALRRVVAWARGLHVAPSGRGADLKRQPDREAIDALPATVLSAELVEQFEFAYVSAAGTSPVDRASALRGAHSALRNAKALFGRRAMRCYAGLALPDLSGFLGAQLQRADAPRLRDLEDATVAKMAKAALALRESARELYCVHLLARHCGLRNVEIASARVGWFKPRLEPVKVTLPDGEVRTVVADVEVVKTADFDPKGTEGRVSLSPCVWAELQPFLANRAPSEYLVAPSVVNRSKLPLVYREHANFVRPWLEEFAKKGYELRRWGATRVANLHESEERAERFLRHAKRTTAGRHYITRDTTTAPITLADCGV